ncbi:MAG TPA: glyoxalase/bleomycin resistance/extradiol dioxygenase family protein, partial [Achromobacter sp.]|nr:glyoxalase/bleomycin resistance/extradiol dioxygenase family protein [Achromobacter sp.]
MIRLHDIRYVRLGTRDLDAAVRYATTVLGLELARKEHGAAYFKSDSRDHTLCYFEGDPRDHTAAFEVDSPEELERAGAVLERSGYLVAAGRREDAEQRYVRDFLQFTDPSGNRIELVLAPHHSGRRYFP